MAGGNRISVDVVMGLKDDELKKGLKEIPQEIKRAKLEHFVKLKLDTSDFRYEAQKGIKEAIRDAQKANAMSYVNGKGKNVNVDPFSFKSLTDGIVHFQKEGVEKAAKALQRLRAEMYLLGQDYKDTNAIAKNQLGMNTRLDAAVKSGKVQATRQKAARDAYRELTKDEREQRQADELYRRRYGAFAAEQTKYEKEQAARAAKLQAEANKRASDNLRSYDKRVEKGTDTLTPELNQLRQMYLGGRSRFVNGSNGNAGLSDFIKKQRESLKSDLAIANGLRQIQGGGYVEDFRRLNNQLAANSQIGKLLRQQGRKPMDAAFMGYINNFGKPINSELAQLNAYYAELEKTSAKSAKKMQDDAKRTAKEYNKISAAVRKLDSHMNKMSSGKGNSNPMLARMRSYYAELEKSSAKSAQQAQRAAIAQENAQNRVVRQYQQQYGILGGLKSRLASYFSIYAVANFGKKVAETTGYFEKQQVALEGILGSASKAQTILSQIKNFALQSPFQTKELVNFTKQLSAFSIPADELFDTTKRLADISAGLGVDMSRIILAYGQVRSAAVLRGQELRQFTEAGIPLVQKLAEKFTQLRGEVVTTADVFELISKRQVSFQMVSDVLADMTKEGGQFYKMQENITNTLYGQMQKLQDMWTIELDKLGKGGNNNFLMGIVKLLQLIIQHTKGVSAALISAFTLNWAISGVRRMRMEWELMDVQVKKNIGSLKKFQMLRLKAFAGNLGWGIAAAGVGLAVGAIIEHLRKLKEVENRMAEISDSFNKETNKMIGGFDDLVKRLRGAKEGTQAYNDAIETLKSNYGEFVNVNQETIATLLSEQKSIDGNITEYQKLRDEIAAAIKLKQEFNELKTQKETLSGIVTSNAEGSQFWGTGYKATNQAALTMFANILAAGGNQAQRGDALNSLFGTNYESTSAYSKLLDDLNKISNETYTEFTSKGLKYKGDFQELFKRNFENQFMLNNFAASPDSSISNWVTNISSAMFAKMTQEQGWEDYVEAVDKLAGEGTDLLSSMIRINNEFDKFNPGENKGVGAVGRQNWQNVEYIKLLNNVTSEFDKLGGNADKLKALRDVIAKNDPNSIKDITDAIDEFLKTITDSKRREVVYDAKKRFVSGTEALTAQEEEIAERMSKDATWAGINRGEINGVKIQSVIDNYNPAGLGEQTVQQTRDKLRSAYDDLRKELKTYTKNAELFKDDIALINAKMRVIERLSKSDLYAVDLTEKNKKGSGSGGGWQRLFQELFSWIKEARKEEKAIIEGPSGLTGLKKQVNDEKLTETAIRSFYDGSPFAKFINSIEDYDIETDFFSSDLKKNLGDVIAKQIEQTGTVDYKDIWNQLLDIIIKRANELEKTNAKAAKALRDFVAKNVLERDKYFGWNDVEAIIEKQLQELREINNNLQMNTRMQGAFERLSAASTDSDAVYSALGFGDKYKRFRPDLDAMSALNTALYGENAIGSEIGNMFADTLKPILSAGELNLQNAKTIFSVISRLQNLKTIEGVDAEPFKKAKDTILKLLDDVIELYMQEIDKRAKALGSLEKSLIKYNTINDDDKNRRNEIEVHYKKEEEKIRKGRLDKDMSDEDMKSLADLQARKQNSLDEAKFDKLADIMKMYGANLYENLRGFADANSKTGLSVGGSMLGFMQGGLLDKLKLGVSMGVASDAMSAAEGASAVSGGNMAVAIIEAIFKAIDGIFKATKDILETLDKWDRALYINQLNTSRDAQTGELDYNGRYDYGEAQKNRMADFNVFWGFNENAQKGWESAKNGDLFGSVWYGLFKQIGDLFYNIDEAQDQRIRNEQDKLIRSNENLERALKQLEHELRRAAGNLKFDVLTSEIANIEQQRDNTRLLYEKELQAKHTDPEKAQEYSDQWAEDEREIENRVLDIRDMVFGVADEIASRLTDPLVEAFRNGENAARSWRDAVRTYIGDVLKQMLMTNVVAPMIDKQLEKVGIVKGQTSTEDIQKILMDSAKMLELRNGLFEAGYSLIDWFNNDLPKPIQEMIAWNSDTSALSGGIQGITEDTGRTLEGLGTSMLAQLVILNRSASNSEGYAEMQISYFKSLLSVQGEIRDAVRDIRGFVSDSYNPGMRSLKVSMQ